MNVADYIEGKVIVDDIKQFKGDYHELATVRFVLKEAAKLFYRNQTFFLDKEAINVREELYNKKVDVNNVTDFSIVCNSYCAIIQSILKEKYGITTEIISPDTDRFRHMDLLLTTKTGNRYIIDPLTDLERMQVGLKTVSFASREKYDSFYVGKLEGISFVSDETLHEIDNSIHYTINGKYVDDTLDVIREEFGHLEETLANNEELSMLLLGKKYEGEELSEDKKLEIKLDYMCRFLKNRAKSNSVVDFIMYTNIILDKLFTPEEQSRIKSNRFFVDRKDIKDERLLQLFPNDEPRNRGVFFEANGKKFVLSLNPDVFLKLENEEWDRMAEENNIYVRPFHKVILLKYLKRNGANRDIVHHNEFLRLFSKFEREMMDAGFSEEEMKKHIQIRGNTIETDYNGKKIYMIENGNLTYIDETRRVKTTVIFQDEGRSISYIDEDLEK